MVSARGRPCVLTGMTGAGLLDILPILADQGIDCVDNLPVDLVEGFTGLPRERPGLAVLDARQGADLQRFAAPPGAAVVFVDAPDDVLLRRLNETTRPHPCAELGRGPAALRRERELLVPMRAAADVVIDTYNLSAADIAARIRQLWQPDVPASDPGMTCALTSFGYKYGPVTDADWVLDARVLKNPFWDPDLRPLTGRDPAVRDFVMGDEDARHFLGILADLLVWTLTRSAARGRSFLSVGVGCTGGRHRSVVVVEELAPRLKDMGYRVVCSHRDVGRPDPR